MTTLNDLSILLDQIDRRLSVLEQLVTSPDVMGTSPTDQIQLEDPDTGDIHVINTNPPGDASGLTATPGAFFDLIFADIEWTAPLEDPDNSIPLAASYEVEFGDDTHSILNVVSTSGTNYRFENLQPNTDYSVRVRPVSVIGIQGNYTAWVDFTTGVDTTIPNAPTGLTVFRAPSSLIASWNDNAEVDVASGHGWYDAEISTDNFATLAGRIRTSATVVSFDGINTEATYKVRVSAIDSSGNQGAWATSADVVAGSIITGMIQSGAVGSTQLAANAVVAGKVAANAIVAANIQVGSLTGDRLTTNTLDADQIKVATSMNAANITVGGSGAIKINNPPTTGIILNSAGLRAYASGATTFVLDASTGSATFSGTVSAATITGSTISGGTITGTTISGGTLTGGTITGSTIQTATSGLRVVVNTTFSGRITFYPANAAHQPAHLETYTIGSVEYFNITGPSTASGNTQAKLELFGNTSNVTSIQLNADSVVIFSDFLISQLNPNICCDSNIKIRNFANTAYQSLSASAFTVASSIRFKKNVKDLEKNDIVSRLKPKRFVLKEGNKSSLGFVAEELVDVLPEAVAYNEDNLPEGIDYSVFTPLLVASVQDLTSRVEKLERKG